MDIKINNVQQNSFTGGLKSLNFINPAAYYANRYFRNSAKLSKQKYDVIMPELIQNVYVRYFKSGGKRISAWDINPKNSEQYVLFLHGMAQNVSNYQRLYTQILDKKFGVFALEYRGYGNNKTCFLSEDALRKDVNTAFKYLVKEKGVKPENIIVMGHSVGGTLAAHLASKQKNIKSLILISPIASLKYTGDKFNRSKVLGLGMPEDLCKFVNFSKVLSWLSNLRFNSIDKIKKVTAPTYILQSKNDTVTPINPARKLVKIAKRQGVLKEFRTFPLGGHKLDSNKINTIGEILDKINAGNL